MSELEDELFLTIKAAGLPEPQRQWRFYVPRRWTVDFAWLKERVIVEVEGGTWISGGGRHNRPGGFERDAAKYNQAALLGYRVLRFTGAMIRSGQALDTITRALEARKE